jgi:hypothetical protein
MKSFLILLVMVAITYIFDPARHIKESLFGKSEETDLSEISKTMEQVVEYQVQFLQGDGLNLTRSEIRESLRTETNETLASVKDSTPWNYNTQSIVLNRLISEYIENVFAVPEICLSLGIDVTRFSEEYARFHEREWTLFRNTKLAKSSDMEDFFLPMTLEKKRTLHEILIEREASEFNLTVSDICLSHSQNPLKNAKLKKFFVLYPEWYGLIGLFRPEDHPEMPQHFIESKKIK